MSYLILLSILNLTLLARLRLIFRDRGATTRDLVIIGGVPLLVLPFLQFGWNWILLAVYLVAHPFIIKMAEGQSRKLNRNRLLTLALHILVAAILCSPLGDLQGNRWIAGVLDFLSWMLVSGESVQSIRLLSGHLILAGLLLVINEMNILLRYLLEVMGLASLGTQEDKVSEEEYSMGRLIGLLERIFVFLFVLLGQYSAIGFILAAKGVTRFNNFKDDKPFAEYVLIGTLLSTLLALLIGWGVKALL